MTTKGSAENRKMLTNIDSKSIAQFLRQQGMDLFDQPNVKGWDGGTAWLTSQTYLQRNRVADLLCNGSSLKRRKIKTLDNTNSLYPKIVLKPTSNDATKIIDELSNRLIFSINESTQKDMQNMILTLTMKTLKTVFCDYLIIS